MTEKQLNSAVEASANQMMAEEQAVANLLSQYEPREERTLSAWLAAILQRIEGPAYDCGAAFCDDPACGRHSSTWAAWREQQ